MSRRAVLRSGALAAGAATVGVLAPGVANAADTAPPRTDGTDLVLLGTAAGPTASSERFGIASALVVRGNVYLVDCGRGAVTQYVRAGLDPARLKGIFVTHLHADHIADHFTVPMLPGWLSREGDCGQGPHVPERVDTPLSSTPAALCRLHRPPGSADRG